MKNIFKQNGMDMTQGPIFSKIIVFALPLIFTNLLQMLYNAADMVVVGKFSGVDGAVGAIGSTGALLNLATNIIIGFSTGAVCVANALGSKDEARTRKAVHSSIFLGIIFGLVGLVIGLTVTKPLLIWMKADPALLDMSVKYCQIVFLGVPFSTVLNYAISILNAKGDTTTPLMILSSSGLLNVILNIAFVKGLGLNVEGVAIATVIANIFSLAAVLIKLTRETGWCQLSFKKYRPDKDTALSIIKIGLPSGIQGTLFSLSNVFIQQAVHGFGAAVVTGNAIGGNLVAFTGQNMGAGKYKRLRKITANSYLITFLVALVVCSFLYLFREPLAHLYMNDVTENADIILNTVTLRFNMVITVYFLLSFMEVGAGIVTGMGKSLMAMIVSLLGACVFRVVWIMTIFEAVHELWVLYLSFSISWALTALIHFICLSIMQRKLVKEHGDDDTPGGPDEAPNQQPDQQPALSAEPEQEPEPTEQEEEPAVPVEA